MTVPAPWTPVEVHGMSVSVWGRAYDVSGGLPAPAVLTIDDAPVEGWRVGSVEGRGDHAAWEASADQAQVAGRIDYDGFVDLRLRVQGRAERVAIEIPLPSDRARFIHRVLEIPPAETNTWALPDHDGVLWRGPFQCALWLGDDEAGFQWCADDPRGFLVDDPDNVIEVIRQHRTTTLRITLVDHDVDGLDLDVRFGLVATPVRPRPDGWRGWGMAPGQVADIDVLWWPSWTDSHADTVPSDPAALRADAAAAKAAGRSLLPYFAMEILSADAEPFRDGRGMGWRMEPVFANDDEGSRYWLVCPNTPWADHFVDEVARVVEECGLSGVYLDFFLPLSCASLDHGCGYVGPDGGVRRSWNVFAFRAMAKRLYERVKAVDPDAKLALHTGDGMVYASVGFGDLMVNGEYKRKQLAQADGRYADVLAPAELRAAYRGEHSGLAPFLLPEFATPAGAAHPEWAADRARTREMLALALAHDIAVWPLYCDVEAVDEARKVLAAVRPNADFVGYWAPKAIAYEADEADVMVSAWLGPTSALVVANPTDAPAHVVIDDPRVWDSPVAVDVATRDFELVVC